MQSFRANGTIKLKHISIKFKAVMPSDILNSLQKSMLLNPVKKEQKGYFRKKDRTAKMGRLQTFLRKHRSEVIGMSIFEYNKEEMKYDSLKVDNNF